MSSRHQGLGGRPLGADSPLFGGSPEKGANGSGAQAAEAPKPIPPWDPRADEYATEGHVAEIETPEEAEAALAELRSLLPADEADRNLDDWGRSERVISLVEPLLNFYAIVRDPIEKSTESPVIVHCR